MEPDHIKIKENSSSIPEFGVNLMLHYFTKEELKVPNTNVFGRKAFGENKPLPNPLDPQRIQLIQEIVCASIGGCYHESLKIWRGAVVQKMNRKLCSLRRIIKKKI